MLEDLLVDHLWLAIATWIAVYLLDYQLTITSARLYRAGAKDHLGVEGSVELTPMYQQDVDALRRFPPRVLGIVLLYSLFLSVMWFLSVDYLGTPEIFAGFLGALILGSLTANVRHGRNIAMFRYAREGEGLSGRLAQSRWLTLKLSAVEMLTFAALYLIVFLLTGSWFFVGGAVMCTLSAVRHWRWGDDARAGAQREMGNGEGEG